MRSRIVSFLLVVAIAAIPALGQESKYFNTVKLGAYLTINGNEAEADAALRKAKTFVPETHTAIQTLQAAHDWYFGDRDKATQVALTLRENRWEQPVSALWVCGGVCMDLHDDWIEQRQHSFAYFVYLNRREAGLSPDRQSRRTRRNFSPR